MSAADEAGVGGYGKRNSVEKSIVQDQRRQEQERNMSEIEPCPNPECGADCDIEANQIGSSSVKAHVSCGNNCGYRGPGSDGDIDEWSDVEAEAIRLHNLICGASSASPTPPQAVDAEGAARECADKINQFMWAQLKDGYVSKFAVSDTYFLEVIRKHTVTPQALAPFEKLVEEFRANAQRNKDRARRRTKYATSESDHDAAVGWSVLAAQLEECADRLSAVVEEVRGK